MMPTLPVEQADGHLAEIVDQLRPGEEIVLTRNDLPVAKLIGTPRERPIPQPGRGKGKLTIISDDDEHLKDLVGEPRTPRPGPGLCKDMITIVSEDDEHLKDFAEYMP